MHDDDEDDAPPVELLLAVPTAQRAEFAYLRSLAALKDIWLYPSSTDDGVVGFRVDRQGEASVRCPDMAALRAQLVELGLPLLSPDELQQLLQGFLDDFTLGMQDTDGPHETH